MSAACSPEREDGDQARRPTIHPADALTPLWLTTGQQRVLYMQRHLPLASKVRGMGLSQIFQSVSA
jgi:hypothetical protein